MGAVGLSFGSPTSGQGFDVTSTVNQIVTNLQFVEKPWKDQLTALQSRDTALSSIGTLLSTLTSDLQNLQDFNGTMATRSVRVPTRIYCTCLRPAPTLSQARTP